MILVIRHCRSYICTYIYIYSIYTSIYIYTHIYVFVVTGKAFLPNCIPMPPLPALIGQDNDLPVEAHAKET